MINDMTRDDLPVHLNAVALGGVILVRPMAVAEVRKLRFPNRSIEVPGEELLAKTEEWGRVHNVGGDVPKQLQERLIPDTPIIYRAYNALPVLDGMLASIGVDDVVAILTDQDGRKV